MIIMLKNKIHQFASPIQTADAVATLIYQSSLKKQPFYMAVSGGSTPKLLFEILAKEFKEKVCWKDIKIFWIDERCVPPTDDESNYKMTHETLLKYVDIPEKNVFRIRGENNPYNEIERYEKLLAAELPQKNGFPCFDLILLGMGDDGHTASIFPNNLSLLEADRSVVATTHPATGQMRVTLTGKVIKNAAKTVFLITGKSKAETLRQIITETNRGKEFPAYYILKETDAEIFGDETAVV